MNTVNPVYNFTTEPDGEFTRITYTKTPFSYKMVRPLMWYTFLLACTTTFLMHPDNFVFAVFFWLTVFIGLPFLIVFLMNVPRKAPAEIKVNETMVVVGGNTYPLDHVSTFIIKDPSGDYVETTFVTGRGAGMAQQGIQNRMAFQKHLRRAQFKIVMRFGTKEIDVATGLGENEAEVLFDKVTQLSGYTKSA